jgi:uncharacterized membrane protein
MSFVLIHAALFAIWMLFLEKSPWPTLTLVVSLEAIFLSTFVIGQNRQAAFQQAEADHDFQESELELKINTELTREIHRLTQELHRRVLGAGLWHGSGYMRRRCTSRANDSSATSGGRESKHPSVARFCAIDTSPYSDDICNSPVAHSDPSRSSQSRNFLEEDIPLLAGH